MLTCTSCGAPYRAGMLVCEDCGVVLSSAQPEYNPFETVQIDTEGDTQPMLVGLDTLTAEDWIVFYIKGADPLFVRPAPKLLIGRADENSESKPDIDLEPLGALEHGISRKHALLQWNDGVLTLTDLGSTNGTMVHERRLPAQYPLVLRDGDQVSFGRLAVQILFRNEAQVARLTVRP